MGKATTGRKQKAPALEQKPKRGRVENLTPCTTTEKARELGRNGGIKSGEARRAKREFREIAKAILDMDAADGSKLSNREAICLAMVRKAVDGDKGAAEFLRDTAGEKTTDKLDVTSSDHSMSPRVAVSWEIIERAEQVRADE